MMNKQAIKQFLEPTWNKKIIFGTFLISGCFVFFLGSGQIRKEVDVFFILPGYIMNYLLNEIIFTPIMITVAFVLSVIYWYIFSCFFISLADFFIKKIKKLF